MNGFTLIELLAVIVILVIILIIAMPIIGNIIEGVKKEAFFDTSQGLLKSAKYVYANDLLQNNKEEIVFSYSNGVETSTNSNKKLEYRGSKPQNGKILILSTGEIEMAIHDGKYCVSKSLNEENLKLEEKPLADCKLKAITFGIYDDVTLGNLITTQAYIPVATSSELNNIRNSGSFIFGAGTVWEGTYNSGLNKKYVLIKNIDLDVAPYNSGIGWDSIGSSTVHFTGIFDGNGYTISNLKIDKSGETHQGLFAELNNAQIRNLYFKNSLINSNSNYSGIIAGESYNNSVIENIDVIDSKVTGLSMVGGIVGLAGSSCSIINVKIENTDVLGTGIRIGGLTGSSTGGISKIYFHGNVEGRGDLGGIVGYTTKGISNSHVSANITQTSYYDANTYIGGLVGHLNGVGMSVSKSYYEGIVTVTTSSRLFSAQLVGYVHNGRLDECYSIGDNYNGLTGRNDDTITKTFYLSAVRDVGYPDASTGDTTNNGGYGDFPTAKKTELQLKQQATYVGWDFINTWNIDEGNRYPTLQWENQ